MIKFLLQTVNGKVRHDFVFEMENAIEYQNWRNNEMCAEYCSLEDIKDGCSFIDSDEIKEYDPIGTVEFVYAFIDKFIKENGSKEIRPLNVPEELMQCAGRKIYNIELTDDNRNTIFAYVDSMCYTDNIFLKSNEIIKDTINGGYRIDDILNKKEIPNGFYQVSSYIDIVSEYRCFIYKDKIVGIQYYSGDFEQFPDSSRIYDFIELYKYDYGSGDAPKAYTLDIFVDADGFTNVMECHEFFSCGLYGFNDYTVLPYMFKRTFDDIKRRLEK